MKARENPNPFGLFFGIISIILAALAVFIVVGAYFGGDRIDSFGWTMIGIFLFLPFAVFSKTIGGAMGTILGEIMRPILGLAKIAFGIAALVALFHLFGPTALAIIAGAALIAFAIWKK